MYIPDLAPYRYDVPKPLNGVVAVGWLSKEQPFEKGRCPDEVIKKIERLILREQVNRMRGTHDCDFCDRNKFRLETSSKPMLLGSAEIWVPDNANAIIFAAPNLIAHYIKDHEYLPPEPFMEAIRKFSEESTWSGQTVCSKLKREVYL